MAFLRLFGPHIAVVLAIGFAIWWIDSNAAERTRNQIEAANTKARRETEKLLSDAQAKDDRRLNEILESINRAERARSPIIEKGISNDPRYTDPKCALTPSVREQINASLRGDSTAPGPGGK